MTLTYFERIIVLKIRINEFYYSGLLFRKYITWRKTREHQLVEGDAVMRGVRGRALQTKVDKSKFVSISLRDKLIFLFVGTLFVELLLFGCVMSFLSVYKMPRKMFPIILIQQLRRFQR